MHSLVWPWYVFIVSFAIFVPTVWWWGTKDGPDILVAVFLISGIIALIFVIMAPMITIGRHYNRVECQNFSKNSNREVRFVIYSTFSWDCITPTENGKWISTDNLREFGD